MEPGQRIGKAARLLDLKGDVEGAVALLESVVEDTRGCEHLLREHVEALVFLADVHFHCNDREAARGHLARIEAIDLGDLEQDLLDHSLRRAAELKRELEKDES